jgi:hypothetical protein
MSATDVEWVLETVTYLARNKCDNGCAEPVVYEFELHR